MKKLVLLLFVATSLVFSQSYHTVTFTGDPASDFNSAEKYTSGAADYYITFDATTLYIGAKNNTGGSFGSSDVLTIYLDTDPNATPTSGTGTTAGNLYNNVTPTLPFTANFTIKVEQSYNESRAYSGGWGNTTGNEVVSTAANAREVKITFANLGSPSNLYITMWMGYSGGYFAEAPSGGTGGTGNNPTFSNYFGSFSISSGVTPVNFTDTPLPVELTSFTASVLNSSKAELHWSTATEVENAGWEIERKTVGQAFLPVSQTRMSDLPWTKVGFVSGAGTTNSPKEYSYTDTKITAGRYAYRLKQINRDGTFKYSQEVELAVDAPRMFALEQNYPNPFNPTTHFQFSIASAGFVSLKVYNILGQEVATLVNEVKDAGTYDATFDGSKFSSGIYYYRLESGSKIQMKKMLLIK